MSPTASAVGSPREPRPGAPALSLPKGRGDGHRPAKPYRGDARREKRSRPSAEPRVHVFRDEPAESPAEIDDEGRPKIRWAHYESDLREAETPDEIETFEETEPVDETPAVEKTESSGTDREPHDAV